MKNILAAQLAALLLAAAGSQAATVEYKPPNLTIVAKEERLDSVLKALGKEMRIYIMIPTGLNPVVNCDIQHRSVKQALKTLLSDMSYSLEWEKGSERLVGLTILAGGSAATVAADSDGPSPAAAVDQAALVEHEAQMATERAKLEARMIEERAAEEERMKKEVAHHEAEQEADLQAFLASKGLEAPQ